MRNAAGGMWGWIGQLFKARQRLDDIEARLKRVADSRAVTEE